MANTTTEGRPTKNKPKFTRRAVSTIVAYIKIGSHVETAAAAAGISRESLHEWMRRGAKALSACDRGEAIDEADRPFLRFVEQLNTAVAEAEITNIERIDRSAETIWQASAWLLERRHADHWGLRSRTTSENLNIDLQSLSNEQLLRFVQGEPLSSILSQPVPPKKSE